MDNIREEIQTFVANSKEHIRNNTAYNEGHGSKNHTSSALSLLIQDQLNDIFHVEKEMNTYLEEIRTFMQTRSESLGNCVIQTGSTKDGGSLARKCYPSAPKHDVELDLLYSGGDLPPHLEAECFEMVPGKPAYVKIRYDISVLQYLHPKIRACLDEMNRGPQATGYFNSLKVKEITNEMTRFRDTDGELNAILSMFFGFSINVIDIDSVEEVKQAASTATFMISFPNYQLQVGIDHVPAIHLQFWPQQARNWLQRKTVWPQQHVKNEIAQNGCHVIPKPSSGGDQDLEWRFSFSLAEAMLFSELSDKQKNTYFLLKAIFYRYIKPIEGKSSSGTVKEIFFSYIVKTIMLWFCENTPPNDQLWEGENILSTVVVLLGHMEQMFRQGKIMHFFIPDVNLLEDICRYAPEALNMAIRKLDDIRQNVAYYVPFNLVEIAKDGQELTQHLRSFAGAVQQFANFKDAVHLLRNVRKQ